MIPYFVSTIITVFCINLLIKFYELKLTRFDFLDLFFFIYIFRSKLRIKLKAIFRMNLNESFEIKKKHVLYAILMLGLYVFLNDTFKNPQYQEQVITYKK